MTEVIGYIYDSEGYYSHKYYFPENYIAKFILENFILAHHRVVITDVVDCLIFTSDDFCFASDRLARAILGDLANEKQSNEKMNFVEVEQGIMKLK